MTSTTSTPDDFFDFQRLPSELRLMVLEYVEDEDICSIRSCSRQLLHDASKEFVDKFFDKIKIWGTVSEVAWLDDILGLPHMSEITPKIRGLHVYPPTLGDLSEDDLEDPLPSKNCARRLLNAMPNLTEVTLSPPAKGTYRYRDEYDMHERFQDIKRIFVYALGRLRPAVSNLACLTICELDVDGNELFRLLSAHSSSLRMVHITTCDLTGKQKKPMTWKSILFKMLREMNLDELFLSNLFDRNNERAMVLFKRSKGNGVQNTWSSRKPFFKAKPVDLFGTHLNTPDAEETEANDRCAAFSRPKAHLTRSWVKKGLEIILGEGDHHSLYLDPHHPASVSDNW